MRKRGWVFVAFLVGCGSAPVADDGGHGGDGGGACVTDASCDDGLFCNGVERCASGFCAHGTAPCTGMCDETADRCATGCTTDADGDGVRSMMCGGTDCDDSDNRRFPGNTEICDAANLDEDCDPTTFGARDADGDGFVDALCCNSDGTTLHCGRDCDDTNGTVHPTATESCNSVDDDCDGSVDEGATVSLWPDADGDTFGDMHATPTMGCAGSAGTVSNGDDCDDSNVAVHPGATEVCDGLDTNCDGVTPDTDADMDAHFAIGSCTQTPGAPAPDDCQDARADVHPGVTAYSTTPYSFCPMGTHECPASCFEDTSCPGFPCIDTGVDLCIPDSAPGCAEPGGNWFASMFGECWRCGGTYGPCPAVAMTTFDYDCDGTLERQPSETTAADCSATSPTPVWGTMSYDCGAGGISYTGTPDCGSQVTYVACNAVTAMFSITCQPNTSSTRPLGCR